MNVEASNVREYSTQYAAHILGYVGPMSAKQWEQYKDNKDYSMDSEIGQSGLEAQYEKYLHGVDGWREDTFTMDGTLIESHYRTEPKAGSNVEVSIDINLQRAAEEEMARVYKELREEEDGDGNQVEGGAVVAVEVKTGKVLVCSSYPTYDLRTFSEDYNDILEREFDPLFNRALLGTYPPGSTYKMSMVVAAIDAGLITSETPIYDKGVFSKYAPGFTANCLTYTNSGRVHGNIVAWEALMVSCNYFFYDLGDKIRLSDMDKTAKALGLGEPTGVELKEYTGYRANEQTKAELYKGDNKNFYQADKILAAIGQSDNRFTPMQLAVYTATLANRGTRYKATFLNRVVSADYRQLLEESIPAVANQLTISDDAYKAYSEGMYNVAHGEKGTAKTTFKNYPIKIAAKTGTAQNGGDLPDNGAFVCYAPFDDPQIAIAIYGEKAGHGSDLATIAKAILDVYFSVGEASDVTTYENQPS
jgi:penicillin-binding protein 2